MNRKPPALRMRFRRPAPQVPAEPPPMPVSSARTLRVLGANNGMGLSRDQEIIATAFRAAGWTVSFCDVRERAVDSMVSAQVHLETVAVRLLGGGKRNIIIPNPEWWHGSWTSSLRHPSVNIWAKTDDAARMFRDLGAQVERIGFRSEDKLDDKVQRQRTFLHVAGASPNKGTVQLLARWKKEWPKLTVVTSQSLRFQPQSNITVLHQRLSEHELQQLQNEHLFHIYPSRYEGFGHAQWEGLSCGAIVFATKAPPFDEYQDAFRLLPATLGERGLIDRYDVTGEALAGAVAWALAVPQDEIAALRAQSRLAWERETESFAGAIDRAISLIDDGKREDEQPAPRITAPKGYLSGVPPLVYIGRVNCVTGQGAAARHQIHVLRSHGQRLRIVDAGSCASPDPLGRDTFIQACRRSDRDTQNCRGTIIHLQPNTAQAFHRGNYPRPHVLVSVWETTKLPAAWVPLINSYDQVWCATDWQRGVYLASGVREELLRTVPFALDPSLYEAGQTDRIGAEETVFGSVFQWTERKDPAGLIGAYLEAFSASDPVVLLLKSYEGDNPATGVHSRVEMAIELFRAKRRLRGRPLDPSWQPPKIQVLSQALDDAGMTAFYQGIDCYVSAHRGEGFALPIAEGLLFGKPVIATGWSAPAEYAAGCFRAVQHTMQAPHGMDWQPFYTADQLWAQADLEDLTRALREAHAKQVVCDVVKVRERFSGLVARAGRAAGDALWEVLI